VEKAGQGVGPKGKARRKKETPTGQSLDTAGGQDARGRPGRELSQIIKGQHLLEAAQPNASR